MSAIVEHSDCRAYLATLATNSVDACTTDPPYELNFMGRGWDRSGIANQVELWREVYRVLKPGGHVVAFGGTRTYHRMVCAIEDAGFEIRDTLQWLYGSGFPKSHDVSKALDKAAGAERAVVGPRIRLGDKQSYPADNTHSLKCTSPGVGTITAPATDLAAQWAGWGTALKPAHEPIVLARKPLAGTVAANVAQWGTGGLNIDASRVGTGAKMWETPRGGIWRTDPDAKAAMIDNPAGRWPPNLLLSHSASCNGHCAPDCPVAALDRQSGERKSGGSMHERSLASHSTIEPSIGGASRFYPILNYDPVYDDPFLYCAKASRAERNQGLGGMPALVTETHVHNRMRCQNCGGWQATGAVTIALRPNSTCQCENPNYVPQPDRINANANHHPTVKPVALCRWLVRLVVPLDGTTLDPFAGSGSFGVACVLEGRHYKGCDQDAEYVEIANRRIAATQPALIGV